MGRGGALYIIGGRCLSINDIKREGTQEERDRGRNYPSSISQRYNHGSLSGKIRAGRCQPNGRDGTRGR